MNTPPPPSLSDKTAFEARAVLIGERIDLRGLAKGDRLATAPLTVAVDGGGVAVLFRFGAVIFFGTSPGDAEAFLLGLRPLVTEPYREPETERLEIHIGDLEREGMEGNILTLQDCSIERLQIVADVLSQSIVLALYEARVAKDFDRVEPFALDLAQHQRAPENMRELLRAIGGALLSEHKMVGRVEIGDKPELLWEHPGLERLYLRLEDEFELSERHAGLERKLDLISTTAHTAMEVLQDRRSLRVEWYIVVLIVFEIFLSLYDLFVRAR